MTILILFVFDRGGAKGVGALQDKHDNYCLFNMILLLLLFLGLPPY